MPTEARVWVHDANHTLATYSNVFIQVWRGPDTLANYGEEVRPLVADLNQRYPAGRLSLVVVEVGAKMPDERGRQAASTIWKADAERSLGGALVVTASTLVATVARAAVNTVQLFARVAKPLKSFDDCGRAAVYLASLEPDSIRLESSKLLAFYQSFAQLRP